MKKLLSIFPFLFLFSLYSVLCTAQADIFTGSELSVGFTPGQVSELQNNIKLNETRISARLNIANNFHLAYRQDQMGAKGTTDPRLRFLQRDFKWVGAGYHINDAAITYYRDTKTNDYFFVDLGSKAKINNKYSVLYGVYRQQKDNGEQSSTGVRLGIEYNINRHLALNGTYEINDKFALFVQDAFFLNLVFKR